MRVAMVSRAPPTRCGVAEYSSMLAESLKTLVDIEFLADVEGAKYRRGVEPYSGVKAEPCFESGKPGFSEGIERAVARSKPDVVHVQHEYGIFPSNGEFVEMVKRVRELGSRVVVTMHTVAHALHKPEWIEFHRALGRSADAIVVHSPMQHAELVYQGVEPSKVRVIPHGTALNPFARVVSKSVALSKLGIDMDPEPPIITTPGFVRADKGLDVLLKSFEIIRRNYDAKLLLIGHPQDGFETVERIRRFLEARQWLSRDVALVRAYLAREELLLLLAAVDIVVLPYRDSGLYSVSGALHLAIGSRKPVVCTQTPRLYECYTIAPELSVPVPEPERVARKLRMVLEGDDIVRECVERLWRYALFTKWDRVAEMHSKLYIEVLESS
ncbi:MAG: glycosyltransferase [Crenarchaeota archaeon]|nr:glycosyltransferase [Thermoproteota archaeon]